MTTIEGIAGSVAAILVRIPNTNDFGGRCTGVLVARDRVLTSWRCVTNIFQPGEFHPPGDFRVFFPQGPHGVSASVTYVWKWPGAQLDSTNPTWSGKSLAVLVLNREISHQEVGQVAPVFLGDLESSFNDGTLLPDDALVAGFGADCYSCGTNQGHRRLGPLGNPVRIDLHGHPLGPFLETLAPESGAPGPEFSLEYLDRGGPLFVREARTNRYVVVGAYVAPIWRDDVEGLTYRFSYLGRVGTSNPAHDHAEVIRPHLGDFIEDAHCEPSELLVGPNSNLEAEKDLDRRFGGMEYIADGCDPVPLAIHDAPKSYDHEDDTLTFSISTWIGRGSKSPEFYDRPINRFCDCYNDHMLPMGASECLEQRCFAGEVLDHEDWVPIPVRYHGTISWTMNPGPNLRVQEGKFAEKASIDWPWVNDVQTRIRGEITNGTDPRTRGFIGTALVGQGGWRSERDEYWEGKLRGTVDFYRLGKPDETTGVPYFPPLERCYACEGKIPPPPHDDDDDRMIFRPWDPTDFIYTRDDLGRFWMRLGADKIIEVTPAIGPVLASLEDLKAQGWQRHWVSAVESIDYLSAQGINERAALVTAEGPIFSIAETGGITEAYLAGGWSMSELAAPMAASSLSSLLTSLGTGDGQTPTLPESEHFLYSASEKAVYAIIGSEQGAKGEIQRTDLPSGKVDTLSFDEGPSGEILGSTYLAHAAKLYVLDSAGGEARLISYDLGSHESKTLWTIPFTETYDYYSLSHTVTGELVLVAGHPEGSYIAWLMKEKPNGLTACLGRLEGVGMPLEELTMGRYAPTLTIADPDGELQYVVLDPRKFEKGETCEEL